MRKGSDHEWKKLRAINPHGVFIPNAVGFDRAELMAFLEPFGTIVSSDFSLGKGKCAAVVYGGADPEKSVRTLLTLDRAKRRIGVGYVHIVALR